LFADVGGGAVPALCSINQLKQPNCEQRVTHMEVWSCDAAYEHTAAELKSLGKSGEAGSAADKSDAAKFLKQVR
jgi:hypothetical protein